MRQKDFEFRKRQLELTSKKEFLTHQNRIFDLDDDACSDCSDVLPPTAVAANQQICPPLKSEVTALVSPACQTSGNFYVSDNNDKLCQSIEPRTEFSQPVSKLSVLEQLVDMMNLPRPTLHTFDGDPMQYHTCS